MGLLGARGWESGKGGFCRFTTPVSLFFLLARVKTPLKPAPMTATNSRRLGAVLVPLVILLALLGGVAANSGLRAMVAQAVGRLDLRAVAAVLPVQLLAVVFCTAAQQALRPGVGFGASFVSRLVRDAGHNLLIFPPGLGEAIGARVMVLLGGRARAAVSLRVLDVAAEVLAQVPYMALAFYVLWGFWGKLGMPGPHVPGWALAAGTGALAGLALAGRRWWRANSRRNRTARHVRVEWHLFSRELVRQRGGMPLAIAFHILGWGMSAVQMWLAAQIFGLDLSFYGALAIEAAATSARVILFFVPGGLVLQEAGAVLAGAAIGVAAPDALALSLVLRLRDVAFGSALVLWPWLEYRRRRGGLAAEEGKG